jgi:hypothetical protein
MQTIVEGKNEDKSDEEHQMDFLWRRLHEEAPVSFK